MANIRSAQKRARQNPKRREHNRFFRARARTAVKNAQEAIADGSPDALEAVRLAEKALDKAAEKGTIHANNASRRKGRLKKALSKSLAAA